MTIKMIMKLRFRNKYFSSSIPKIHTPQGKKSYNYKNDKYYLSVTLMHSHEEIQGSIPISAMGFSSCRISLHVMFHD